MRILIADTDETTLAMIRSYLCHHGFDTEMASDAIEGVTMLREFRPHALILGNGLQWGGSDGLLEFVQEEQQCSNLHLVLTAYSPTEFDSSAIHRPVVFLRKPIRLVDLLWQMDILESVVEASCESVND